MNKITKEQAAYIAGFFDGEGSISSPLVRSRRVRIAIGQKNLQVLQCIYQMLGIGHLHRRNKHTTYSYHIDNKKDVLDFIHLVQPYCVVKKEKLKIGKKLALLTQENSTKKISSELHSMRDRLAKQLRDTPNG